MSSQRPTDGWNTKRKPLHPGEMLREEFMVPLNLSANRLVADLHVPVTRITEIVNERRAITADTVLRLARHFGNSPGFWMNLQEKGPLVQHDFREDYELTQARQLTLK